MNDITFIIPTFNPEIDELKKAVNSALKVKDAHLIFVDDKSTDESHFEYLFELEKLDNVTLHFNKENLGPFWNSINAYKLPKTKWCKKLDPDDEVFPEIYNNIKFDDSASMYLTGYRYKKINMNRKLEKDIGHIFNGAGIYKTESVKEKCELILKEKPEFKKWFEDLLIPFMIILNNEKVIKDSRVFYYYKELATSKPKHFKKNYELWMSDYTTFVNYLESKYDFTNISDPSMQKMIDRNHGKEMIFANLLSLSKKDGDKFYDKLEPSIYKRLPKWFRKIIANITMLF